METLTAGTLLSIGGIVAVLLIALNFIDIKIVTTVAVLIVGIGGASHFTQTQVAEEAVIAIDKGMKNGASVNQIVKSNLGGNNEWTKEIPGAVHAFNSSNPYGG